MIDFSSITRRNRTVGRLLKLPLHLIPKGAVLPIVQGVVRGRRWVVGSTLYAVWLGSYEIDKQRVLAGELHPGSVFYDVGANVGFFTVLGAHCVGPGGAVYAFEPLPSPQMFIESQRISLL